jgi:hypothetical protein
VCKHHKGMAESRRGFSLARNPTATPIFRADGAVH